MPKETNRRASAQRHVQHHHDRESHQRGDGHDVAALVALALGYQLGHDHVDHRSGGEGEHIRQQPLHAQHQRRAYDAGHRLHRAGELTHEKRPAPACALPPQRHADGQALREVLQPYAQRKHHGRGRRRARDELIENGLCGSFFGPWWAPNNPLANAVSINSDSNWQPYLISTGDNVTEYHSQNPCYKYVVVRKGYEYPEIAAKMISVMFDKIRFDCADSEEFDNYYQLNVEPTARPLSINVDYNNALSICYRNISDAIEGRKDSDNLELLERSYYNACKSYLNNTGLANTSYEYNTDDSYKEYSQSGRKGATSTQWAAYMSRIKACRLLDEGNIVIKQSLYFKTTDTMKNRWWKLKSLEKEAYLKIISGEADIDYFDTFVSEWNAQGGIIITEEVRENIVR